MKVLRFIIGQILLALDFLTRPSLGKRSDEEQTKVNEQLKNYSLYQFSACPFCIKVRRVMRKLNLPIELRNANTDDELKAELKTLGGSSKVPCLRIGDTWMYESNDIIKYLEDKFPISK
ncbi:glutathione S-transferase N-terminal domain-containing protein [Halobacteriovorax sp. HLS]|uniref:glutaredoxin family protein n=1 Tax=Halobacteriovorax sp. HLS TaxID=2234000 RepID=UPI000FD88E0E|nr:glutathione S-transferase N-terminal domain-containing protein [Halobacteriovorax sp. HLS]